MMSGVVYFLKVKPWRKSGGVQLPALLRDSYARINPSTLSGLGRIRDERQWRRYLKEFYSFFEIPAG
jgi:hypothetical protein